MLSYQTLRDLLLHEFVTKNNGFNSKKRMSEEIACSIFEHTKFLDYPAPLLTRVSYLLAGEITQRTCIECGTTIRSHKSFAKTSKFCSASCSKKSNVTQQKRITTTIQKYGVQNIFQRTDIISQSIITKYGVDNISKLDSTKKKIGIKSKQNTQLRLEKTKISNLKNYGVEHTSSLDEVKGKVRSAMIEHYGVPSYFCTAEFKTKMNELYDGMNPFQIEEVKKKSKLTKFEKYGDENFNNRGKASQTMIEKFGCHPSQSHWSDEVKFFMEHPDSFADVLHGNTINAVAEKYNLAATTVRNRAYAMNLIDYEKRHNQYEDIIAQFLKKNNIKFEQNNRSILAGKELDFYLPEKEMAIECNGIFWHSELMGKGKDYHLGKTKICDSKGIRLLHLWDYQFDDNLDLLTSMLSARLGIITSKISARNTQVKSISSAQFSEFMGENHIQGKVNASIRYGLFSDGILVSAMGFGKSRYLNTEYELLRFASIKHHLIVGGASKLLTHFIRSNTVDRVITYADRDISAGNVYDSLGFTLMGETPPSYLYFKNRIVYNRLQFQKHKLSTQLDVYDANLTEWQNMVDNGYNRFWNTGNFKYEITRKNYLA